MLPKQPQFYCLVCAPRLRRVQSLLRKANRDDVEVEVVFPVNPRAITTAAQVGGEGGSTVCRGAGHFGLGGLEGRPHPCDPLPCTLCL